jgi:phage tail sheath protein FI
MAQYNSPGVYVEEVPSAARPIAGVGTSTAAFIGIVPNKVTLPTPLADQPTKFDKVEVTMKAAVATPVLVSNWSEFVENFADLIGAEKATGTGQAAFTVDQGFVHLAHAVFGFFNNGGSRCWVVRIADAAKLGDALSALATIDEIAIVCLPGRTVKTDQEAVLGHCETLKDRVAVLDGVDTALLTKEEIQKSRDSSFGAIYFPWLRESDPSERLMNPEGTGLLKVPPSGHVAGIYAQVDGTRGVHKAPANVVVRGADDLVTRLTTAQQDGLNPKGVNVLRSFNGTIKVWGGRTMGGSDNGEFTYVSTRRFFNFLRESIDEGTQFVVFEPNSPDLWERIKRSVGDFLLNQWRDGALFGTTPKQAFFVKCDEETNPSSVRESGQVITEIGVAIVKPAEFVIFRIQQTTGG